MKLREGSGGYQPIVPAVQRAYTRKNGTKLRAVRMVAHNRDFSVVVNSIKLLSTLCQTKELVEGERICYLFYQKAIRKPRLGTSEPVDPCLTPP